MIDYVTLLIGFYFGYAIRHLYGLWNVTYHSQTEEALEEKADVQRRLALISSFRFGHTIVLFMLIFSALTWPLNLILSPFRKMIRKKFLK